MADRCPHYTNTRCGVRGKNVGVGLRRRYVRMASGLAMPPAAGAASSGRGGDYRQRAARLVDRFGERFAGLGFAATAAVRAARTLLQLGKRTHTASHFTVDVAIGNGVAVAYVHGAYKIANANDCQHHTWAACVAGSWQATRHARIRRQPLCACRQAATFTWSTVHAARQLRRGASCTNAAAGEADHCASWQVFVEYPGAAATAFPVWSRWRATALRVASGCRSTRWQRA